MKTVEVTATVERPRSDVERKLDPESIIEYSDIYMIRSVQKESDKLYITAQYNGFETILKFYECNDGYLYKQDGNSGPFKEMETKITVSGSETTDISIKTSFDFGGKLSAVKNWFGTTLRRQESEQLLRNLTADIYQNDSDETEPESS